MDRWAGAIRERLNLPAAPATTATAQNPDQASTAVAATTTPKPTPQHPLPRIPLLFTLPAEIFDLILSRLTLRDTISLSLTAKALRHIYTPPTNFKRRRCAEKIHSVFLSSLPSTKKPWSAACHHSNPSSSSAASNHYKCPYCNHSLCPPTCNSALLLDSNTGIFFPASLWPDCAANAKFLYTHKPFPAKDHVDWRCPPSIGTEYSTIWCEHHRCPRDLFSIKSLHRRSGVENFLGEFRTRRGWKLARKSRGQAPKQARWFVGYKTKSQEDLVSMKSAEPDKHGRLVECFEKVFYETFCRHCLRPIEHIGVKLYPRPLGDAYCTSCSAPPWGRWNKGCVDCGIVSAKVTMIDVFDETWTGSKLFSKFKKRDGLSKDLSWQEHEGYWLFLATECRITSNPFAVEKRRLEPVDADKAASSLAIVRGRSILSVPPPKIGIQDLPYKVLAQILGYLQEDWEDSSWYYALTASYCFLKASQRVHPLVGRPYTTEEVWRESYRLHSIW